MGVTLVIVYALVLDFAPGILQRHKPVLIQTLLQQPAVERLYRGIIRGRPWPLLQTEGSDPHRFPDTHACKGQ